MKTPQTNQMKIFSNNCMLNVITTTNYKAEAVVVYLHGGPGQGLKPMMENPTFQSFEKYLGAIHFDQRGCGKSDYDLAKGLTLEQCLSDIKSVVNFAKQQFKERPVYLFGPSFGGLLALLFDQTYPGLVEKIVLVAPILNPSAIDMQKQTLMILQKLVSSIEPASLTKSLEPLFKEGETLWGFWNSPELASWLTMFPKPLPEKDSLWQMYAMRNWLFNNCNVAPYFKDLKTETLCLQGMDDEICPPQLLIDTLKKANNRKVALRTFSNCGHSIVKQAPDEFIRITTEFLLG